MSCSRELRKLLEETKKSKDSEFKDGYVTGLEDAIDIVNDHEEGDEDA